ncbi:MAG: SOS response-associated peptidase [Flavobacterium sp.]
MCFHTQQTQTAQTLQQRFKANFNQPNNYKPTLYNGFEHPAMPVITHQNPEEIQMFHWGFLPQWATAISFRKNTLNAKAETLHQLPSFQNYTQQRCLILIDGFYEWQWLDIKGKNKQKYLITKEDKTPFALAGLWNTWAYNTLIIDNFTIITTVANPLMETIHNTKKRMPFILNTQEEHLWLDQKNLSLARNVNLYAEKV